MKVISKASAIALAVVLAMPGAAKADISTVQMMSWCKPLIEAQILPDGKFRIADNSFESGVCYGAFETLYNLSTNEVFVGNPLHRETMLGPVCPPDGVGRIQMVRIFDAFARKRPEFQHFDFAWIAREALRQAFPCKAAE
jgi:Rap1a immunity proteins